MTNDFMVQGAMVTFDLMEDLVKSWRTLGEPRDRAMTEIVYLCNDRDRSFDGRLYDMAADRRMHYNLFDMLWPEGSNG